MVTASIYNCASLSISSAFHETPTLTFSSSSFAASSAVSASLYVSVTSASAAVVSAAGSDFVPQAVKEKARDKERSTALVIILIFLIRISSLIQIVLPNMAGF